MFKQVTLLSSTRSDLHIEESPCHIHRVLIPFIIGKEEVPPRRLLLVELLVYRTGVAFPITMFSTSSYQGSAVIYQTYTHYMYLLAHYTHLRQPYSVTVYLKSFPQITTMPYAKNDSNIWINVCQSNLQTDQLFLLPISWKIYLVTCHQYHLGSWPSATVVRRSYQIWLPIFEVFTVVVSTSRHVITRPSK